MNKSVFSLGFLVVFIVFSFNYAMAQTVQRLSGTVIYHDQRNRTTNTPADALDGNVNTYYQSDGVFGNWIGLDLGSPHIITAVDFYARRDNKPVEYAGRLELGIIEGANNPDFGDAMALAIISKAPIAGKNTLTITSSKGYRYVRFVFPSNAKHTTDASLSKYMAELQFFGYAGEGDNTLLPTLTNLPTVNIHTVNAQDITSKEYYLNGIVNIVYDGGKQFFTDSTQIRGRGNNSWTYPKKPYRLKLYNSTKLMGLPAKAKNWTLINNYGDKTLMRNMLAFDFSRRLEMPYTSPAIGVDVVFNGDYKGCYQLCDHLDVRKNRIDIEEMKPEDITGGYHIEIDAYADEEDIKFYNAAYDLDITIKDPSSSNITAVQKQYITSHFKKLTDAMTASYFTSPSAGYRAYFDTQTYLRYFLIGEYTGSTDTFWSMRMYKFKNDEKFYSGPVWDFDLSFDNDSRTYPINQHAAQENEWLCISHRSSVVGDMRNFARRLFADNSLKNELRDIYAHYRDHQVINKEVLYEVVDSLAENLSYSQALNFKRWPVMGIAVHMNPVVLGTYAKEVQYIKNYINLRLDWLDQKLDYTPAPESVENYPYEKDLKVWSVSGGICIQSNIDCSFTISDVFGKKVQDLTSLGQQEEFTTYLPRGVYLVHFNSVPHGSFVYKSIVGK